MYGFTYSKKRFWLTNLLSMVIILLLAAQVAFAFLQSGRFASTPKVAIHAQNSFDKTLRVVADIDFAPYSSVLPDGSYTGYDIECINDIANRLGVNLDIQLITWTRAVDAVKNGDADIVMGLESISNRNDGLMLVSIMADDAFVVYGKAPISSVEDLKRGRIATIAGKTEVDIYGIEENAISYDTYSEELQALERGEVDYAILRASVAKMLIHQNNYTDLLQVFDMMDSGLGLGVREGETLLATQLDRVIHEMHDDGTVANLQKKWLTTYVSTRSFAEVLSEHKDFYFLTMCAVLLCAVGAAVLLQQERAAARQARAEQELEMSRASLATKEAELADSRARIMLSQIQPHFLYNALGTIGQLSRRDSDQAADAIDAFARYLRTNLESVEISKQVSFSEELQHVKTYLWLEKMRFGEDLNIVYDIRCEGFALPPLTVQPIVENAVKHGLGQKEEGGTVTVRSLETEDLWLIQIEDDGVGFDEETALHDGRTHIGIENVRRRLQYMCGGTLSIESAAGNGTVATIRIPKS